ncbi:DUF3244 domain-containing protein [Bacteroidales bacterium OttesenSCG-928-I14]|nr:DUF3244 domain-containing protein [Bacteroidales bacterium OttesenSCG-928-I14]
MRRIYLIFIGIIILLTSIQKVFPSSSEIAEDMVNKIFILNGRTYKPQKKMSSVAVLGPVENNRLTIDFEGVVNNEYITIKITSLTGESYIYNSVYVDETGILTLNIDLEENEEYSIEILSEEVILEGEI